MRYEQKMIEINKDVIYVKGAVNGAIYDFNSGNVFSINDIACDIIERYINKKAINTDDIYIQNLIGNKLISYEYEPVPFFPAVTKSIELQMAWIEITQACNLKCIHCYEGNVHRGSSDSLTLSQWFDVIDQLGHLKIKRLIIIGGEPCCNPDIMEILERAMQYDINITLFTNGTCITDALLQYIIRNKINVKMSIYGHCAKVHDLITTIPGSFEKTIDSAKRLIAGGVSVSAAIIIMKENEQYVQSILDYVKSIGMKCSRYDVIREVFKGTQNSHIPLNSEVISEVYRTVPNFKADKILFYDNVYKNSCWYGKISIMDNGDVIPCEFERDFIYGNVKKSSINEIIHGEAVDKGWFMDFGQIDGCKDCEYRFACRDCRPMGRGTNGEYESKNPRCRYDVYSGVWLSLD